MQGAVAIQCPGVGPHVLVHGAQVSEPGVTGILPGIGQGPGCVGPSQRLAAGGIEDDAATVGQFQQVVRAPAQAGQAQRFQRLLRPILG